MTTEQKRRRLAALELRSDRLRIRAARGRMTRRDERDWSAIVKEIRQLEQELADGLGPDVRSGISAESAACACAAG